MTSTDQLYCSICFVVDGEFRESDDLSLPDLPVEDIITILIKKLDLQSYLGAPQYGRPTLHRFDDAQTDLAAKLGAPLAFGQNLSQAGIKSGSKICLVITPQYLPITIHWSAGSQKGRITENLATGQSIDEHINILIQKLQLRERVDGPMKSVASLHLTADGPPLPPDMILLQLKFPADRERELWLKVEPRFLPVTLQVQFPAGNAHEEQRYVPADRPIAEIRDNLIQTIPAVRDAVKGKERCLAELCHNGAALPLDQTLRDLAVPENTALQLVLTPTMAEVTLQLPIGIDGRYQPVTKILPLNAPIRELINTIARDHQLLGEKLTLAPSLQAPAWKAEETLADYGVRTGAEIWGRLKAQAYPPFIVIGGAALAVVVIIAIVLAVWLSSGRVVTEVPPAASTTSAPTSSPAPPTQTPTPLPTPTRTADEQKRYDFAVGLEAYDRQDWPAAAEAFKRVFAIDPDYLDVGEKLAATHYNWAVHTLTGPEQARQALAIVRETFVYSPTHQLGRELEAKLDGYVRGVEAVAASDLGTAIAAFEQVAASDPTFLDVAAQLYEAALALSRQQREANQLDAALATCTRAVTIPNVDTSAARQCVAELQPTPTPRPRPTPKPEPHLFVYRKDRDPNKPRCISIRIVGIASTGWYFTVDGLGYRGNFQGGDAAACQLQPGQEVTFSIYDANGRLVRGGGGIPAKGGDIFIGEWRR